MDNHTEQFKWDDKLVQDYIQFYAASYAASVAYFNSDETLEKFKQSKSKKEEPQWEILEFECKTEPHTIFIKGEVNEWIPKGRVYQLGSTTEIMLSCGYYNIRSVKRFPDNTVWSVDMVTEHGIITAFKIVGSTMVAEIKNNIFPYDYPLYLSELKAPKEEQVPIKVHSLHHLGENSNDAATQIVTSHRIPPSKYQSIKSAIEDVLNSETLESIKKKYEDIRKEINREAAQKIFDINNNARNQFS